MVGQKAEGSPIRIIVEATAFFLSGLFLIDSSIYRFPVSDVYTQFERVTYILTIDSWDTLFIGALLALTGFVYLLSTFVSKLKVLFDKDKQYEKFLVAFLFGAVLTEIIKLIFETMDTLPLFIITIAFAALVLIVIVLKNLSVFNNIGQLFSMSCAMIAMFISAQFPYRPIIRTRWDLVPIFFIALLLLLRAAYLFLKKTKNTGGPEKATD
jgi:hypothetical protein